ncbi:MAG: ATP-binding protein [Geminicoccaceae bacterium]
MDLVAFRQRLAGHGIRDLGERALAWLRRVDLGSRLALLLTIASVVSALITYVILSGAPTSRPDTRTVLILLNIDLVLLLLLGAVVSRRLVQLYMQRREGLAGSRLHGQLVALFSVVAVTPAIIVAVFSVTFLHFGLESWFSQRVSSALRNSLSVAQAYLEEHKEIIRADALAMAADINREGPALVQSAALFQRLVETQAALRSLTEALVLTGSGAVVARTGLSLTMELEQVPESALQRAEGGEVVILTSETDDRVRALVRLDNFVDAYLYVGRFVDPRVLEYMDATQRAVRGYQQMESGRSEIQIVFTALFGLVALLLLLAAVWVGLALANRLVTPIGDLIVAANRVSAGDLSARVPPRPAADELASLSRAFNRMTGQLARQRAELIEKNQQLDMRRQFTEAVLTGVSAGVLGLDARRRIILPNQSAASFVGGDVDDLIGRPVGDVLPGVGILLSKAAAHPDQPLEQQLVIDRHGRPRTLLVRVAAQTDPRGGLDGYVVTFDDITELLGAQRKAAWTEIARRIAHEIKNPLTPIQLNAERLKRKYARQITQDVETFSGCADTIVARVDTIRRLIDEFSDFARMPAPEFDWEAIDMLLRQVIELHRPTAPNVHFALELPDEPSSIYCDRHQISQALTNLVQNAVNAILEREGGDGHGEITLRLSHAESGDRIDIEDTGPGFPEHLIDDIRRPYVTTREKGTGLGLAIVEKIMEEHGGALVLANRRRGGAVVSLVFPARGDAPRELAARAAIGAVNS